MPVDRPDQDRESPTPSGLIPAPRPSPITPWQDNNREGITLDKILFALSLPLNPHRTETILDVEKFEDLRIDNIRQWVSGLVIGVEGTLRPHHTQTLSDPVIEKLKEARDKMNVCIFSNNNEGHEVFQQLGIKVVKHVPPQPSPEGFNMAAQKYLNLPPGRCAKVGDNILTDGGARDIGMHLILVDPIPGPEGILHKIARGYGRMVKYGFDSLYGTTSPLKKKR